ncbi:hypothetical protein EYR38_000705 [Pleurotus pulmonarius]|nr:hypothetical protein EYR38_000705 [Pleurotus pulmonarius]
MYSLFTKSGIKVVRLETAKGMVQYAGGGTPQIAWALYPSFSPLLLIAVDRRVLVLDTKTQSVVGKLRGHGGTFTGLQIHVQAVLVVLSGFGVSSLRDLDEAFHPVLPVLATCGADCALKIWYVRPRNTETLVREDKPLFSTSKIHQASIGSIVWLNHELLLSHCASPVFRRGEGKEAILNTGEGTLVIWEWLTANLFFPSKQAGFQQDVLRGSTSECQDSSSLKVIAEYAFEHQLKPNVIPRVHSSTRGEPQVSYTYPGSQVIRIVELATVKSRKKPILANSDKQALLQDTLERHLNIEPLSNLGSTQLSILPEEGSFHACAMNPDGDVVIGTGEGAIWIWHK